MQKQNVRLAFNLLKRDWRRGELRIVILALTIAVASITMIGYFVERVQYSFERQSAEILGADRVVRGTTELPSSWEQAAKERGLQTTKGLSLASVLVAKDNYQLARINAVSAGYPLRGKILLGSEAFETGKETIAPPKPGEIWVESRVLNLLSIKLGDRIEIGEAEFTITAIIIDEPGKSAEVFNVAPHVLMNLDDIPETRLILPGSRVSYRLYIAGLESQVIEFAKWLKPQLNSTQRLLGGKNTSEALGPSFERADNYLQLAGLISVILAGIAIATASGRYARRHYDYSAILRCLGATQGIILRVYGLALFILALAASCFGAFIGFMLHQALFLLLADFFPVQIDYVYLRPAIIGIVSGCVVLLGFSLPHFLQLKNVSPLRVLRRELGPRPVTAQALYISAISCMAFLMYWYTQNLKLVIVLLGAGLVVALLIMRFSQFLIGRMTIFASWLKGGARFGLAQLTRFKAANALQVSVFSFALLVMMVIVHIRTDLLGEWEQKLPENAPNYFLINIQPQQVGEVQAFLKQNTISEEQLYPMVRGRVAKINGQDVEEVFAEKLSQIRSLQRELNLSMMDTLPKHNRLVEGIHNGRNETGLSVEEGFAQRVNLKLGDRLTFNIGGQTIEREITSIREVQWDSFKPNFFVVFPPGHLDPFPKTFITSVYIAQDDRQYLNAFVKSFPTITVLELEQIMQRVKSVLSQVTLAVEFILSFVLIAGIVVLMSAVQATMDERQINTVIVRTLGGRTSFIKSSLLSEFTAIGLLAGFLAAAATELIGYALSRWIFEISATLHPWLWLVGPLLGMLLINAAGRLLTRDVVKQSPLVILRDIA